MPFENPLVAASETPRKVQDWSGFVGPVQVSIHSPRIVPVDVNKNRNATTATRRGELFIKTTFRKKEREKRSLL